MVDFGNVSIGTPKRSGRTSAGWEGFFPYYAGFPEAFVTEIIKQIDLPPNSLVADPWNGSGTTTYASNTLGFPSWGGDLNPAMVLVAKARLLPASEADSLNPLAHEICRLAGRLGARIAPDPLARWFDEETTRAVRSIELSIRRHLVGQLVAEGSENRLQHMSTLAAAFYVGLFAVVRSRLGSLRTSNPTWMRKNSQTRLSIAREVLYHDFKNTIASMAENLSKASPPEVNAFCPSILKVADATQAFIQDGVVDLVITSPPYCTRLDYTSATRVELALIEPWFGITEDDLSRQMLGSVKVPQRPPLPKESWGGLCLRFLEAIRNHKSKASAGYYYKNHADYFAKLAASIANMARCLKVGGGAVVVVQDSYYKDVHNPLPGIVTEMAEHAGLRRSRREDFHARRSLSSVNKGSKAYREYQDPVEAVLCFSKEG